VKLFRALLSFMGIIRLRRCLLRIKVVHSHFSQKISHSLKWVFLDTEYSNFYYELTPISIENLTQSTAVICQVSVTEIDLYVQELLNDRDLMQHIKSGFELVKVGKDAKVAYGRRIVWYAIARAIKPKIVVETGVEHGVGACVITSALLKNQLEGFTGRYIGTELNRKSGKLLSGEYASVGTINFGDSVETLSKLENEIDLFINDSSHDSEYELLEYFTILDKLSHNSIILSDNAHVSSSLSTFSRKMNRKFIFLPEQPANHWYSGGGVGISY
jgi:hypothetical protein